MSLPQAPTRPDARDLGGSGWSRSANRRAKIVALTLLAASFLAIVRLASVGWSPEAVFDAGSRFADPTLPRQSGWGYDGEFYFRLAKAPFSRAPVVAGIRFDFPSYRQQRIGYPLLVWVAGLGRFTAPLLLIVNVASLGILVWLGMLIAVELGRDDWWGLSFVVFPGFAVTLMFDLAEIVAAALVLAATLLILRNKPWSSIPFLIAAGLTRETTLVLPLAAFLVWRKGRWLIPPAVVASWDVVVW
jgi:hypothetical protein